MDRNDLSPHRTDGTTCNNTDNNQPDLSVIVSTDGYAKYNAYANSPDRQYQDLNDQPPTRPSERHAYTNATLRVNVTGDDDNAYEEIRHDKNDGDEPYAAVC